MKGSIACVSLIIWIFRFFSQLFEFEKQRQPKGDGFGEKWKPILDSSQGNLSGVTIQLQGGKKSSNKVFHVTKFIF